MTDYWTDDRLTPEPWSKRLLLATVLGSATLLTLGFMIGWASADLSELDALTEESPRFTVTTPLHAVAIPVDVTLHSGGQAQLPVQPEPRVLSVGDAIDGETPTSAPEVGK